MQLIEVGTDEEIIATFTLMKQLRPHLMEKTFLRDIRELQNEYGYKLIVIFEGEEAKAAAGFRICSSLAWGKYLYVDDLITDELNRSKGFAKLLFDWLDEESKKNEYTGMHLDSGVHRYDAHRFYINRKMKIICHHFEKTY